MQYMPIARSIRTQSITDIAALLAGEHCSQPGAAYLEETDKQTDKLVVGYC